LPANQRPPTPPHHQQSPGWPNSSNKSMAPVRPTVVTQIFHFPAEERRYLSANDHSFGDKNQEQDECNGIMQKTGTTIDLCQNKDQSLTIVVSGKRPNVEEARKLIVQSLQTQSHREIRIPKDHHRSLIGREGKKLQSLEKETDCRIMIPNRDNASEIIKIVGPREGIEKAIHQIQLISDEQSKMAQEHLNIPKVFYPWIRGPFNETIDRIIQETGARVNIPPPTATSDFIVITGERDGVFRAAAIIRQIYEEKKNSQTVSIQVDRNQHRFVIGHQRSGLSEILRDTGVSVEVPPEEAESKTITLRGDSAKLGAALAMVFAKASSVITGEVECPTWLHKYVIGTKGSIIRQIVGDQSNAKTQIQVTFEEGRIFLEGPPEEVKRVRDDLAQRVKQLQNDYVFEILHITPIYHRHIIGKAGGNISKIRQDTGVSVSIPADDTHSDEVRLEGKPEGVAQAKAEIMEIVKRMENEKSRDIIIENRFHRTLIGTKGETVRELREKFPGVIIHFPEPGRKTDIVTLRGPKDEVDKCYKHLQGVVKELKENNYQEKLTVFKDFHRHIIGKGGATIKKIRDETDTKIELPLENSNTDVITLTGKKANVEKAKEMLTKLENELSSVVTAEIVIPHKIHSSLIGGGGRLIQHIAQTECGGVQIKFPPEKTQSDKVTIRGPKEGVEKAKKLLLDLAKDKEMSSFTAEIKAKPELFRFLIGRGGTKIHKLREAHPHVRIMLPRHEDADQETIHLVGKKEDVEKAKSQMESVINELTQLVEINMDVDQKWHRHFVGRGANVLHEIQDQCGGVIVSFPKQNTGSTKIIIKGGKECVESAKKRIQEIVDDLEAQVTIKVHVPQHHHRLLLAGRGAKIQDICHQCNVQIKFPERARTEQGEYNRSSPQMPPVPNGNTEVTDVPYDENAQENNPQDYVLVTGRAEKCEEAKELLLAEIPISETINVPYDYHRNLIGKAGVEIRKLMDRFKVNIRIPPQDDQSDEIVVTGPPANVKEGIAAVMARIEELDEEAKDRELKSHQVFVTVPAEFHSKLIGTKGSEITRLRNKYDVQITIPPKNAENPNEIIITGYEKNAEECKEFITKAFADFQSLISLEITLDARIHSRLIGQRGKNIRKIMDQYGVEIRFPRNSDPDPNLVIVSGKSEEAVYDCIDDLRNIEEEYLQDIVERYRHPQNEFQSKSAANQPVMEIRNAPWNSLMGENGIQVVPDVNNAEDFPTMGGENSPMSAGASWGPRKY
jgi:predicted PilT family ATPase